MFRILIKIRESIRRSTVNHVTDMFSIFNKAFSYEIISFFLKPSVDRPYSANPDLRQHLDL